MTANSYATDGRCHNAQRGTFNHECGKPAVWLGTKASGFQSNFCDWCRHHGDEAVEFETWERIQVRPQMQEGTDQ